MKFLAIFMTIALLGVMSWVVFDARGQATKYKNEFELLRRQQSGESGLTADREKQIAELERQLLEKQAATDAPVPPLNTPFTPGGTIMLPEPVSGLPGTTPAPAPNPGPTAPPPPLTPRQRQVQAAPSLGKVIEYQKDYGFVVFNGGAALKIETGMTFALRRGPSVVGRITVTSVEDGSAIADLISNSVPPGVAIELGDDVIQDLP